MEQRTIENDIIKKALSGCWKRLLFNRQNIVSFSLQRQDLHQKVSKSCRQSKDRIDENISM